MAYCEAASGWWRFGQRPLLSSAQRIELAVRGFNTLRFHGNYATAVPTLDGEARRRMVRLMWSVLQTTYLRPGEAVGVAAPAVEDDLPNLLAAPCADDQAEAAP